jgi:hypothetical protein
VDHHPLNGEARAAHDRAVEAREEAARAKEIQGAVDKLAEVLGSRYYPEKTRLDAYRLYHPAQRPVLERVRRIAGAIGQFVRQEQGLVLFGTTGTGKDHLLAAMLYAVVRAGISCHWIGARQLTGTEKMVAPRIDAAARPKVLGFSDPIPPAGMPATWHLERFYDLLDRRDRRNRLTWVTLNAASKEAAEEALSAAVWSRMAQRAILIPCFWPDYRARTARGETLCSTPTEPMGNNGPRAISPPPPR